MWACSAPVAGHLAGETGVEDWENLDAGSAGCLGGCCLDGSADAD